MAVKKAGVELQVINLSQYVAGMQAAAKANADFVASGKGLGAIGTQISNAMGKINTASANLGNLTTAATALSSFATAAASLKSVNLGATATQITRLSQAAANLKNIQLPNLSNALGMGNKSSGLSNFVSGLKSVGGTLSNIFKNGVFGNLANIGGSLGSSLLKGLSSAASGVGSIINGIVSKLTFGLVGNLTGLIKNIATSIGPVASAIVSGIGTAIGVVGRTIGSVVSTLASGVTTVIGGIARGIGSVVSGITGAISGAFSAVGSTIGNIASSLGGTFGNIFSVAVGSVIGNGITAAISGVISAAAGLIQAGLNQIQVTVKVGLDYQQDLANIQADLTNLNPNLATPEGGFDPATAEKLAKTINKVALDPKLVVGFDDAAVAAKTLTRYGYTLEQVANGGLNAAVLLQNSVGGSFSLASETLAKYASINNIAPEGLADAVSQITATITQGGFRDLNDYRYALVNSTGAIKSFGVSQEDTNTILAVSNKLFASGRTGGTGIRSLFEHLVPTTDKAKDAMKALNLSFFDSKGKYVGFAETIQRLRKAFSGLSEEEAELRTQQIFGATAGREVRDLLNEITDEEIANAKATILAADATKSAGVRTDTLGAKLGNLGDQFQALRGLFFSKELQNVFVGPVEALQNMATALGPTFAALGHQAAVSLKPFGDAAAKVISHLTDGSDFKIDLGNLKFGRAGGRIKVGFGDLFQFDSSPDSLFVSLLRNTIDYAVKGNRRVLSIGDLFTFDTSPNQTFLQLFNGAFSVLNDKVQGTVDLQAGSFHASIKVDQIRAVIDPIINYITSIPARIGQAFSPQTNRPTGPDGQGNGSIANYLKGLPGQITLAFTGLTLPDIGSIIATKLNALGKQIHDAFAGFTLPNIGGALLQKLSGVFTKSASSGAPPGAEGGTPAFAIPNLDGFLGQLRSIPTRISEALAGFDITKLLPASFSEGITSLTTYINNLGGAVSTTDLAVQGITADGGALGQLRTFVSGFAQSISQSISSIDPAKALTLGGAITSTLTTVIDALTRLSSVGNTNVGIAVKAIGDVATGLLNFATGVTQGLDATKLAKSASGFVTSLIDEFTVAIAAPDVGKLTTAATGFVAALTGKFNEALSSGATKDIGVSVGKLAATLITQLGAALAAPNAGKNIGDSLTNSIEAFSNAANNIAGGIASELGKVNWNQFGLQINTAAKGIFDSINTKVRAQRIENENNAAIQREKGRLVPRNSLGQAVSAEGLQRADEIQAGIGKFGEFLKGVVGIKDAPSTPIPANAEVFPQTSVTVGHPGTANDFSTALAQLSTLATANAAKDKLPASTPLPVVVVNGVHPPVDNTRGDQGINTLRAFDPPKTSNPIVVSGAGGPTINTGVEQINASAVTASTQISAAGATIQNQANAFTMPADAGPAVGSAAQRVAGVLNTFILPTVPAFPGWAALIGPVDLASKVAPFPGWGAFIKTTSVAIPGPPKSAAGGKQSFFPGFASGTKGVKKTGTYLVGEEGPEFVNLQAGDSVTDAQKTKTAQGAAKDFIKEARAQASVALNVSANSKSTPTNPNSAVATKQATSRTDNPTSGSSLAAGDTSNAVASSTKGNVTEGIDNKVVDKLNKGVDGLNKGIQQFSGSIEDLQGFLKGVPGLFGASPVTQEQLDGAAAGIPQNFADDFVRQLGAEVANKNQEFGNLLPQAIEALGKVGVAPGGSPEAILAQIQQGFSSGSLFANKDNLGLINSDAVAKSVQDQQNAKTGQDNILAYFTQQLGGAAAQFLGASAGKAAPGQGISGDGTPVQAASSMEEFPGWATIIPAFPSWSGGTSGIVPKFPDWGGEKGVVAPFPGWEQPKGFIPKLVWKDFIASLQASSGTTDATPDPEPPPAAASGRNATRRGAFMTGEQGPEISTFPNNARIFPAGQTSKIMSVAEAIANTMPNINSDPIAAMARYSANGSYGQTAVSRPETNVYYRSGPQHNDNSTNTRVFQLNVRTEQNTNSIAREFQNMQVQASN